MSDGIPWTVMGAADFDKRRAVKGYKAAPVDQAGLFYAPVPERDARPAQGEAQRDGQPDLFGTESEAAQ